ncbi:HWE histidine kinase domain-containing protein [Ensifer aridi]|uniref:HWE histidine kinase domain-containing protein n=1 Tax=Ensifer aridi TaxID=1708715 RepID=UPI000479FD64|nr:HWE histidine kinase domain-containing protein [Ensifer aridi]
MNTLANRSLYESQSHDEFRDKYATRLGALSRTQDLLMRAPAQDVLMAEVLRLELEAQGGHLIPIAALHFLQKLLSER